MNHSYATLEQAITSGEYHPDVLATFEEWHALSRIMQFHLIRKALDTREHDLVSQYAEISNVLDFSKKPHLKGVLENIQKNIKQLAKEREELYVEYTS